ncbi:transmembrane protein 170B [Cherax quadricarinatus]|uniref:transmembrane protein 170B n=1 Tax=Cherax quadricarinatus TaxID=27406 RepID=UPI0023786C0F|nr:transmembrane protein 170B-like [Cherax quadricarinatus]XP_053640618.1 transmembrane protein 170B-like [Cherax quadricarinatus]XP_053640619.1 transmembrane protein 170B-like [Cherax quadricarinatus]XP_053640621.1 transmembrane protein 170B-like [Cherax quadricarinatus]XP_053640622.1 transmembrane protein 170B-like [Cherax quadricarinatus]
MKRTMHHKGWCLGVVLLRAIAILVIWGPLVGILRGVKAVVAYSTQLDTTYAEGNDPKPLETFPELWQRIFLWGFFSLLFIHIVSAIIAFLMLRRHKYGRFSAACIILIGMCTTFTMCAATSAAVGFVLYQAKISLQPIHAMICGIAQTALYILFSFSRVMPTL